VADQLLAVEGEGVNAAERVLPVALVEVALEDLVQQPPRGVEGRRIEVRGVGGANLDQ
jgi:hypothetical protein